MGLFSAITSAIGTIGANKTQRRINDAVNATLARILPVQQQSFNAAFDLTGTLNDFLLRNEAERFNQVSGAEVASRNDLAGESIANFDEQAAAVGAQTAANRTAVETLADALRAAMSENIARYTAERDRQLGYQGEADAASSTLLGEIGAAAHASRRLQALTERLSAGTAALGPVQLGGYTPPADGRVVAEFDRRAQKAHDDASADLFGSANVSSYGDALSGEDRTLSDFNSLLSSLSAQARASAAPLDAELAAGTARGRHALAAYDSATNEARNEAEGRIRLSDRYRTGRMSAMRAADDPNIQSMSEFFQSLAQSARTGYGGQANAWERYGSLFENLMNQKAARIANQPIPTNPLIGIAKIADAAMSMDWGGGGG